MAALYLWGIAKHLIHFLLQSLGHTNGRCKNKYSHLGEGNRSNHDQKAFGDPQCALRGSGSSMLFAIGVGVCFMEFSKLFAKYLTSAKNGYINATAAGCLRTYTCGLRCKMWKKTFIRARFGT